MALTAAERMKKYREKLKQNPQKYEEVKKKHAERVKQKSKKISDLTEDEKEKKRKKWREQKRKQKINIISKIEDKPKTVKSKPNRRSNRNKLARKYNAAIKRIQNLKTALNTSKKRLYRLKKLTDKKIQKLEETINKMKARDEILESCLKASYEKCRKYKDKNIFKTVTVNKTTTNLKMKTFVSKLIGLKGIARSKVRILKENKTCKDIQSFYMRDDISKSTSGKKECRTYKKQKEQIRYLTDTLYNIYKIYRSEGGTKSFATFHKYRPFYVLSPTVQNRNTCLCIKHSNFQKMFYTLQKIGVLPKYKTVEDIFMQLTCDIKSKMCMYGECEQCREHKLELELNDKQIDNEIEWEQWENVNHEYNTKKENKMVKTKRMGKVRKTGNVGTLIQNFKKIIPDFKKHYYNWKHQQYQYRKCITELKGNEAVIICDFSENYCSKLAEEVQSMHFGASKQQFTLHTGMIYWAGGSQSFCTISDNNAHDPAAIWAHLIPIIKLAKQNNPLLKVLHFYSDGPCTQYRQKKNFFLHNLFTFKLGLDYSTWSFTESGHGKSVADGIGGVVKRFLDKQVAYGNDVSNGEQAVEILSKCMKSVKCLYIINSDIDNVAQLLPKDLTPLTGTMQIHQVIANSPGIIQYRPLSCFCALDRGLCDCFGLQTHTYGKSTKKTEINCCDLAKKVTVVVEVHDAPISKKKKIATVSSVQKYFEEDEDIINEEKHKEEQERVEEIYDATFKTKEEDKVKLEEVNDDMIAGSNDENQDKLGEINNTAFDSIIIPLDNELSIDVNNIEDLYTNLKVFDETELNYEDNKLIQRKLDNEYGNKVTKKRSCIEEEKCYIQPKKLPKISKEKENYTCYKNQTKSIRNVISRHAECPQCKIRKPLQLMKKCMACKKFVCLSCNDCLIPEDCYNDYICDICLAG